MDKTVSVAEAKNKLPSILHEVEKGTMVKITRHGKSVAIVIPPGKYDDLEKKGKGLMEELKRFRNLLVSEKVHFSEGDFINLRDRTPGRSFSWNE
ncbi:MAG: type II toxin-antitoxin system Phd/YefM family antitoxin [Thermodesulfobacteriota bacterium]